MKKVGSRFVGLLLAVLLLLGLFPAEALETGNLTALPVEGEIRRGGDGQGNAYALISNFGGLGEGKSLSDQGQVFAAPNAVYDGGDLYSQLSVRQKACYNAIEKITIDQILAAPAYSSDGLAYHRLFLYDLDGMTGISIGGKFTDDNTFVPSASGKQVESGIYTDLLAAFLALRYDRPDLLWLNAVSYGYWVHQTAGGTPKVTRVMLEFYLEYGDQEKAMYQTVQRRAAEIAEQAKSAGDTYSQVKAVHDLLAQGNSYGNTDDLMAHTAYSALVFDDRCQPVCDGYSKAFKLVCDQLGIPCAMPSSKNHMWNNVKMDDGDWYILDLTWDDSNDEALSYDYFLIGSQTVVDGQVISKEEDHTEENPYEAHRVQDPETYKALFFRFPSKNKVDYQYLGKDYEPLTFLDVKRSSWCYEAVENAAKMGLFVGDENGLFQPGENITRGAFARVMALAMGADLSQYTQKASFDDVEAGKWYTSAAAWVKEAGLMQGGGDNCFRPNDNITRQEMCVVLSNALKDMSVPEASRFPDDGGIAPWAKAAVYRCRGLGLVLGDDQGYFNPTGKTQRSAAAVVFTKFAALDSSNGPEQEETTPEETQPEGAEPEQTQQQEDER